MRKTHGPPLIYYFKLKFKGDIMFLSALARALNKSVARLRRSRSNEKRTPLIKEVFESSQNDYKYTSPYFYSLSEFPQWQYQVPRLPVSGSFQVKDTPQV